MKVYFALLCIITLMMMACSDQVAGTTTTENGIVTGTVLDSKGQIAINAKIQLIPASYDPVIGDESLWIESKSDSAGYFSISYPLEEDFNLLVLFGEEGYFISSINLYQDPLELNTASLVEVQIKYEGVETLRLKGSPYIGKAEADLVYFSDLAPGEYPELISPIQTLDTQLILTEDQMLDYTENIIPPIPVSIKSIDPTWVSTYTHVDEITSISQDKNQLWIGTESSGIWYSTSPGNFLQNSTSQSDLYREPIEEFQTWSGGVNSIFLLKSESYCYLYLNSAYYSVGNNILDHRVDDTCQAIHLSEDGEIFISFDQGIDYRDTQGNWSVIDLDSIVNIKVQGDQQFGLNTQGELYDLKTSQVIDPLQTSLKEKIQDYLKSDLFEGIILENSLYISKGQGFQFGFKNSSTRLLKTDTQGRLWGLTEAQDLWVFDGQEITIYQDIILSGDEVIVDLYIQDNLIYLVNQTQALFVVEFPST